MSVLFIWYTLNEGQTPPEPKREYVCCNFFRVSLILNGEPVISIGGQNNTSASNSVVLPLNRDDRVWMQLYRGQLVELHDSAYSFKGLVFYCIDRIRSEKTIPRDACEPPSLNRLKQYVFKLMCYFGDATSQHGTLHFGRF